MTAIAPLTLKEFSIIEPDENGQQEPASPYHGGLVNGLLGSRYAFALSRIWYSGCMTTAQLICDEKGWNLDFIGKSKRTIVYMIMHQAAKEKGV